MQGAQDAKKTKLYSKIGKEVVSAWVSLSLSNIISSLILMFYIFAINHCGS